MTEREITCLSPDPTLATNLKLALSPGRSLHVPMGGNINTEEQRCCGARERLVCAACSLPARSRPAQSSLSLLHGQNLYVPESPAASHLPPSVSAELASSGPFQPQWCPSVLGSYLAPPS